MISCRRFVRKSMAGRFKPVSELEMGRSQSPGNVCGPKSRVGENGRDEDRSVQGVARVPTFNQLVKFGRRADKLQDGESGTAVVPAKAGSVHACVHTDAEKAELGSSKSGSCPPDEWDRSYDLYSRYWPQPAGALDCADPRGSCKGSAGRALSRGARHAGCDWSYRS